MSKFAVTVRVDNGPAHVTVVSAETKLKAMHAFKKTLRERYGRVGMTARAKLV